MTSGDGPRPLLVGTPWLGYAERRNFGALEIPGARVVRITDPWRLAFTLLGRGRGRSGERYRFRHSRPSFPRTDVLHFFNSVTTAPVPWMVTFETTVPKADMPRDLAQRVVEDHWCRRLIAMSECARRRQVERWERRHGSSEAIREKLVVAPPPQAALVEDTDAKPDPSETLRLVFVGSQFFRKGGRPLLRALDGLLASGAPLEVDIVSSLECGDRWSRATDEDVREARRVIERHGDRLRLHRRLANDAVLGLLRSAHALLLPTLAETYGYTVLEAQASGCAVVTTNVRALPELNDRTTGWTIDLDLLPGASAVLHTEADVAEAESRIEAGVVVAIEAMLGAPERVLECGAAGLARIRREHDPRAAGARLAGWYREAAAHGP